MKSLLISIWGVSLLVLLSEVDLASSFSVKTKPSSRCPSSSLWAKPPPTAGIDLAAIEAFEQQLDKEENIGDLDGEEADDFDLDLLDDDVDAEQVKTYSVPPELNQKRIDAALSFLEPSLSRSFCGNLVTDGRVALLVTPEQKELVDRKSFKVQTGQELEVSFPPPKKPTEIIAQDIPLDILYEDQHIIVMNKAANMVVHPAAGNWDGTLVNALAFYFENCSSPYGGGDFFTASKTGTTGVRVEGETNSDGESMSFRPGIVHRLDKGTTGILVVAKTLQALATLSQAFAERKVQKTYLAITVGNPGQRVVIDKPIGRHPVHRQRMRVVPDPHKKTKNRRIMATTTMPERPTAVTGRRALSYVNTIAFDGKLSLVQVRIETGRTHQIRVHLADRHTPIYGDDVYGLKDWNKRLVKTAGIERPLLHAYKLELDHPITGERMTFQAPMPEDMLRIAKSICPGENELPGQFQQD